MTLNKTLSALSEPTRRRVLELLKKKDMTVTELNKYFDITMPSLSHHLSVLKQTDLVTYRRRKQELVYSLNLSVFEEVAEKLFKFFKK
jgi:ArsR family transcriptional regulator, arsenate/arsenite/antimonite-responsive transcriptional repressor